MKEVTDPALLEALNAGNTTAGLREVTDPAILAQLEGESAKPNVSMAESAIRGAGQGATAGFSDELQALAGAGLTRAAAALNGRSDLFDGQSWVDTYREARDIARRKESAAYEANPATYIGGGIAGGVLTAKALPTVAPFKGVAATETTAAVAPGVLGRLGNAAAAGGAYGAVGGLGSSNADLTKGEVGPAAGDALLGGIIGGVAGTAIQGVTEIPEAAKGLYNWVRRAAPSLSDEAAKAKMSDYVVKVMKQEGITPEQMAAAMQEGKDAGVNLSLPQATQSPTLIADQKTIAGRGGASGQDIRNFQREQLTQEVPTAIKDQITKISPNSAPDVVGAQASKDAGAVVKAAEKAQADKAGPLYNSAFKNNPSVQSSEIDRVLATPAGRQALKTAATKMQNDMTLLGVPDAELAEQAKLAGTYEPGGLSSGLKLRTLDYVKRSLDDQIEVAQRAGERDNVRILTGLKNKLVAELDNADVTAKAGPRSLKPEGGDYARARATYGSDAQGVNDLKLDKVGQLSKLNISNYETAAPKIFNDTPEGILRTRQALEKQNPQGWRDITASFLQDSIKNKQGYTKATTFRDLVLGDKENARRLEAALPRDQYNGMKRFGEVLDKALSTVDRNSDTAFKSAAGQRLDDATGLPLMQKGANPLNPANWPRKIIDQWNEKVRARDFQALTDILLRPDMAELGKQLAGKQPDSAASQRIVARFLEKNLRAARDMSKGAVAIPATTAYPSAPAQ